MAKISRHKEFTLINDEHYKFWNITEYKNGEIKVEYGKIGTRGQSKLYPAFSKDFDRLVFSKLKKGYTKEE